MIAFCVVILFFNNASVNNVATMVFSRFCSHCSNGVHRVPGCSELCPSARHQNQEEEI